MEDEISNLIKESQIEIKNVVEKIVNEIKPTVIFELTQNEKNYIDFELPFADEKLNLINALPGVYFIQINLVDFKLKFNCNSENWKERFTEFWENPIVNTDDESMPKIHNSNLKEIEESKEWVNLYLGKRMTLRSRVKEHLFKSPNKKTGALKLDKRVKDLNGVKFRLTTFSFPKSINEIDILLCSILENKTREELKPILGRK